MKFLFNLGYEVLYYFYNTKCDKQLEDLAYKKTSERIDDFILLQIQVSEMQQDKIDAEKFYENNPCNVPYIKKTTQ